MSPETSVSAESESWLSTAELVASASVSVVEEKPSESAMSCIARASLRQPLNGPLHPW